MAQVEILEKQIRGNDQIQIVPHEVNFETLQGRGGAFLITPLDHGYVFHENSLPKNIKCSNRLLVNLG